MNAVVQPIDFTDVAAYVGTPLLGPSGKVHTISTHFPPSSPGSLSFCTQISGIVVNAPAPALVITLPELASTLRDAGYSVAVSDHPKYEVARLAQNKLCSPPSRKIHPKAHIGPDVKIGQNVSIGPGSVLDGLIQVEDNCVIGANACIMHNVIIGSGSTILNGGVIGETPYSFGFGPKNHSIRFPATGRVIIGRNVEIGNNVVISRGVSDATVLSDDCRVNDLAHIGNTVFVGKRSLIMANCDISARVAIGEECWIGQSAVLIQAIRIGNNVQIGAAAVVTRDIPNNVVAFGSPAKIQGYRGKSG